MKSIYNRSYYFIFSDASDLFIFLFYRLLFRSVEIVWNLLENGNKEMLVAQLNSLSAINQLRGAFLKQLFQGFSNYDRQLRNDILIISIELANIRPTLPFIQSGFAKDLLNFATYPESI